jgi:hypothetical protein
MSEDQIPPHDKADFARRFESQYGMDEDRKMIAGETPSMSKLHIQPHLCANPGCARIILGIIDGSIEQIPDNEKVLNAGKTMVVACLSPRQAAALVTSIMSIMTLWRTELRMDTKYGDSMTDGVISWANMVLSGLPEPEQGKDEN